MKSIDDPLPDSQKPSTNTAIPTTSATTSSAGPPKASWHRGREGARAAKRASLRRQGLVTQLEMRGAWRRRPPDAAPAENHHLLRTPPWVRGCSLLLTVIAPTSRPLCLSEIADPAQPAEDRTPSKKNSRQRVWD